MLTGDRSCSALFPLETSLISSAVPCHCADGFFGWVSSLLLGLAY